MIARQGLTQCVAYHIGGKPETDMQFRGVANDRTAPPPELLHGLDHAPPGFLGNPCHVFLHSRIAFQKQWLGLSVFPLRLV
jgi:hypothetical protein